MSDLQNPLFDEEKEFLERKKLEYERALRGDVEHIKEKSVQAGKVVAVGAGLAGSIWLITKAFSSRKSKSQTRQHKSQEYNHDGYAYSTDFEHDDKLASDDFGRGYDANQPNYEPDAEYSDAEYFTAGNGKRYRSKTYQKPAATSAQAFADDQTPSADYDDDLSPNSSFAAPQALYSDELAADAEGAAHHRPSPYDTEDFEDDPFQDLPYDDSRRLPASHAFDDGNGSATRAAGSNMIGKALQAFLRSDTGKVLVAQAAAVVLALVTKKVGELFPADKNADLASVPGHAPVETGVTPAVSLASPDSPDASTHSSAI
jgi:hypothetical protein